MILGGDGSSPLISQKKPVEKQAFLFLRLHKHLVKLTLQQEAHGIFFRWLSLPKGRSLRTLF